MKIDRTHRGWLVVSAAVVVAATAWYWYDLTWGAGALNGPSGSSTAGRWFGVIGSICLYLSGLLGVRKRLFRTWRFGRAQAWLRAHLWLGLLSLPLLCFHGG